MQEQRGQIGVRGRGLGKVCRGWSTCCGRIGQRDFFSLEKTALKGLHNACQCVQGGGLSRWWSPVVPGRSRRGMGYCWTRRFWLVQGCSVRIIKRQVHGPREFFDPPSLEVLKTWLDKGLSYLVQLHSWPLEQGIGLETSQGSFQPELFHDFVIKVCEVQGIKGILLHCPFGLKNPWI